MFFFVCLMTQGLSLRIILIIFCGNKTENPKLLNNSVSLFLAFISCHFTTSKVRLSDKIFRPGAKRGGLGYQVRLLCDDCFDCAAFGKRIAASLS